MTRRFLIGLACIVPLAFAGCGGGSSGSGGAAAKADPRESLDTTLPEAIRLLEAGNGKEFAKAFIPPDEFAKMTEKEVSEFDEMIKSPFGKMMIDDLKAAKDIKPTMSENDTKAVYEIKKTTTDGGGSSTSTSKMKFKKVGKLWYVDK